MGLELMFKSWVLCEESEFKPIHDLLKLNEQVEKIDSGFSLNKEEGQILEYLSDFVELRYPSKNSPVEIGEEDIIQVNKIADKIWAHLPESLYQAYKNIQKGKKGGRILMERPSSIPFNFEDILKSRNNPKKDDDD